MCVFAYAGAAQCTKTRTLLLQRLVHVVIDEHGALEATRLLPQLEARQDHAVRAARLAVEETALRWAYACMCVCVNVRVFLCFCVSVFFRCVCE
jgi:hypothetical protein